MQATRWTSTVSARATSTWYLRRLGDLTFAVVENLVVDQEGRGNGIGQALLREVERFCLSRNCSKMMLLSSASRVDAHRFFEQVGFHGDRKRGFVKYRSRFAEAT
ncbi:GNAT family N-acetyltransferase [Paraburkholderia caledonica]